MCPAARTGSPCPRRRHQPARCRAAAAQTLSQVHLTLAELEVRHWDSIRRWSSSDLSLLLEAGCDLMTSLKSLQSGSPEYRKRIQKCIEAIQDGSDFPEAVEIVIQ